MTLDLREVIGIPGTSLAFDYQPDLSDLLGGAYCAVSGTPRALGSVRNSAGALSVDARVTAEFDAVCSRCLKDFTYTLDSAVSAALTESDSAIDDAVLYYVGDARLDINELLVTELLLGAEQNPVCREDCPGLCHNCGADLNEGGCGCKKAVDPRLAALEQLIIDNE